MQFFYPAELTFSVLLYDVLTVNEHVQIVWVVVWGSAGWFWRKIGITDRLAGSSLMINNLARENSVHFASQSTKPRAEMQHLGGEQPEIWLVHRLDFYGCWSFIEVTPMRLIQMSRIGHFSLHQSSGRQPMNLSNPPIEGVDTRKEFWNSAFPSTLSSSRE